ncbi:MAG: ComEC/Rec2 family competence protein [Pyrinomonadaceae bacterium]
MPIAFCFCLGIAIESLVEISFWPTLVFTLLLSAAAFVFRSRKAGVVLALGAFFVLGSLCSQLERESVSQDRIRRLYDEGHVTSGDPVEVKGSIIGVPEPAPDGYFITLDTLSISVKGTDRPATGRVRIFVPLANDEAKADFDGLRLDHGTLVVIACRLEREDRYLNPGVYSRRLLLDRQRIDATASLKSPLLIENVSDGPFSPIGFVSGLRAGLIQKFRKMYSAQTAGVLIASMLGDKYFLDKRTADVFREGGTFHVLVISGLHITFIGGMILLFVRIFTKRRWTQAVAAVSLLWFYGIAVGAEPPVMRACVMFTILMIGYAEFRLTSPLNALGACALVLLAWRPSDLFDPSFQLTFVSVAAIVAIGLPLVTKLKAIGTWMPTAEQPFPPNVSDGLRRFCETVYWRDAAWEIERGRQIWSAEIFKSPFLKRLDSVGLQRTAIFIFEGVIISAAVQLCMLPLLVYYFHRFPLTSIALNLWVGSVLAAESICGLIAAALSMLSGALAFPFIVLTEFCNWLIVTLPASLGTLFNFSSRIPIYSGNLKVVYLVYFFPVVAMAFLILHWDPFAIGKSKTSVALRRLKIGAITAVSLMAGVILLHPFSAPAADGRLHVEFLDVGQGDAAFIGFPNGKTMLIDAGGRLSYRNIEVDGEGFEPDVPRIGEAVVSEFLWEKGVSHVDMIVATHADADHIQGLSDITRNFSVSAAYFGRIDDDPELKPLLEDLERFGVPRTLILAGDAMNIGGVQIEFLNPSGQLPVSVNNDSVVVRMTFGDKSFLFTGDIERQGEALLLGSDADLHANVIKVPHHGSRSSSTEEFVNAAKPSIAVISVGRHSLFGHPHKEVVERWKAAGASVMTTGERGTITITTDGQNLQATTFLP